MGNNYSNGQRGPTEAEVEKYHTDLKKWKEDCACMEAEESAQRARVSPDVITFGLYCLLQGSALCFECPIRSLWHQSCCFITSLCFCPTQCLVSKRDTEDEPCFIQKYHYHRAVEYNQAAKFLFWNMCFPCDPHYIFETDVSLTRPRMPVSPFGAGGSSLKNDCDKCLSCTNDCCNLYHQFSTYSLHPEKSCCQKQSCCSLLLERCLNWERFPLPSTNKQIITQFCCLSLYNAKENMKEAYHLSSCFGPFVCFSETPEQRLSRWGVEAVEAKKRRTDEFWEVKRSQPDRYSLFRSASTGQIMASIVEEYNNNHGYLYPWAKGLIGTCVGCAFSTSIIGSTVLVVSQTSGTASYSFLPVLAGVVYSVNMLTGAAVASYGGCCGDHWKAPSQCPHCCVQSGNIASVEGRTAIDNLSHNTANNDHPDLAVNATIEPSSHYPSTPTHNGKGRTAVSDRAGNSSRNLSGPIALASLMPPPQAEVISRPMSSQENSRTTTDESYTQKAEEEWFDAPFTPTQRDDDDDDDDNDVGGMCTSQ